VTTTDQITKVRDALDREGVTVVFAELGEDVAAWDESSRVFTVDRSASVDDQTWAMIQLWGRLVTGRPVSAGRDVAE
jgi:hypothetical protein